MLIHSNLGKSVINFEVTKIPMMPKRRPMIRVSGYSSSAIVGSTAKMVNILATALQYPKTEQAYTVGTFIIAHK